MKSRAAAAALLVLVSGPARADAGRADAAGLSEALDAYESGARELSQRTLSHPPAGDVAAEARALFALADAIGGDFAVLYPTCGPYLGAGLRLGSMLDSISLAEIERDYHAGRALPEAPGFCYHALDLAVHAATVAVVVRGGDVPPDRIVAELAEALANLAAVRRLVTLAQGRPSPNAPP